LVRRGLIDLLQAAADIEVVGTQAAVLATRLLGERKAGL